MNLDELRVYADQLLENGDPQGEAIQIACELETISLGDPKRPQLQQRLDELLDDYSETWIRPVRDKLARPDEVEVELVRGMPTGLAGDLGPVLEEAAKVPHLNALEIYQCDRQGLVNLAKHEVFGKLARLTLGLHGVTEDALAKFCASPSFPALEHLDIGPLGGKGPSVLAEATALASLRYFHIRGGGGSLHDLAPLLERAGATLESLEFDAFTAQASDIELIAKHCKKLRSIVLDHAGLDPKAAAVLASAFENLELLSIGGNPLREAGIAAIAGSKTLGNVVYVSFERRGGDPEFGAKLLGAFADALVWKKLQTLDVRGCNLKDDGAKLLGHKAFAKVRELDLGGANLGDKGVAALAAIESLRGLRVLHLNDNSISQVGMAKLAKAPWLANLEELYLAGNEFKTAGGEALAKGKLTKLRVLGLGRNAMASNGMRAILDRAPALTTLYQGKNSYSSTLFVESLVGKKPPPLRQVSTFDVKKKLLDQLVVSPNVGALRRLRLHSNALDDASAMQLAANRAFDDRVRLEVISSRLGDAGRAALTERFGDRVTFE